MTAAATREFPTLVILSIVTGSLVCEFDKVHEAIEWMAGEPVWTHQLPRVSREIQAAMLVRRPELAAAVAEAEHVTHDNYRDWVARWVERYGETMTVERLSATQHASKNPIAELTEMAPDKPVIVVETKV